MTYYQILEIFENASQEEISSAFKRLAKKYHPDLNHTPGSKEKFIEIFEAYEILREPNKKKIYDDSLKQKVYSSYERSETARENEKKEYETYKEEARERARKYSNESWKNFYNSFIKKVVEVGKTTVLVAAYIGLSVIETIIKKLLVVSVILVPVGIVAFCSISSIKNEREKIVEQRNIEYENIIKGKNSFISQFSEKKGVYILKDKKIVIIDESVNDFSEMFFNLPIQNRPNDESEVDYVIQIRRNDEIEGHYTDGDPGYKIIYFVGIIDYKNKLKVAELKFEGSDPPRVKNHHGSAYGSNPLPEIESSIRNLLNGM